MADEVLRWAVPAAVVLVAAVVVLAAALWLLRRARRSPRARAAAEAARQRAGAALVRLDDAVAELDLEAGLSGALYGGRSPAALRRAKMTAQHVRDDAFAEFAELSESGGERDSNSGALLPADVERRAARIERRAAEATGVIGRARTEHAEWVGQNVSAAEQVAAARARLAELRRSMGDPEGLVRELSANYDETEWRDAATAAREALKAARTAETHLDTAAIRAVDPSRTALPDLAAAERALRRAQADERALEETHRLVTQAAAALAGEFAAARGALRQALDTRQHLDPAASDRLGEEVHEIDGALTQLETDAARRPTATVARIARLRDRLDLALGDARTAQQRLRGARTALPGTLAAARAAVAAAEAAAAHSRTGADARVRLVAAQRQLADARTAEDPVDALDTARRALRDAEDAKALADYDRALN